MINIDFEIIIGLIPTIATVIVTLFLERRREGREDKKEAKQKTQEIFDSRPEFSIVDFKDYISRTGYGVKQDCDISVFLALIEGVSIDDGIVNAKFRMEDFNSDEWCCVIYTFENVGKTDVTCIYPISMIKRTVALYNASSAKTFAENGALNYSEGYDKKIRVGETFTLKICYHKDHILSGVFSASIDLGFEDSNGHFWMQPLFAPEEKIYDSYRVSYKNFREALLPETAEKCFKNPGLW